MEDYLIGVFVALSGVVAFMVGQRLSHKNETLTKQARWYEEELDNMRTEVKRYRAKASYYAKGAVPSELGNAGDASQLIDGILGALPPNFRTMIAPWRSAIMDYANQHPEMVGQVVETIKTKMIGGKEMHAEQIDSV